MVTIHEFIASSGDQHNSFFAQSKQSSAQQGAVGSPLATRAKAIQSSACYSYTCKRTKNL